MYTQGLELKYNRFRKKEKFGERGYRGWKKSGRDKDQQLNKNLYMKQKEDISSKNQNNNVVRMHWKENKWKYEKMEILFWLIYDEGNMN